MSDQSISDDPPAGLVAAQRIAIQIAEVGAEEAKAGQTEREFHDIVNRKMLDAGATGSWSPTTVGFGIGTLSCFPTDVPSERTLWNLDLGMIDVHPVTADGWWGDCTRSFQVGDNHAQAEALMTIERIHATVLDAAKPGMRACDWFGVFAGELAKTPYVLLDRLSNIGHSLSANSSYDDGYIDAGNEVELRGAWAVEPFIGNHLYGVKREDVVWFGPNRCTVIT